MVRTRRGYYLFLCIGFVALAVVSASSLAIGASPISFGDSTRAIFWPHSASSVVRTIVYEIRMPRTVLAWLTGAGLSLVGAVMQAFFQNPMAGPYLVGVSSGAALGATVAILFGFEFSI